MSFALVATGILAYLTGLVYVKVSPPNTYRLNDGESLLIGKAISEFRGAVEEGAWDTIAEDLSKGRNSPYRAKWILASIKKERKELGKPRKWEFFRCAQPQKKDVGTVYHLDYITQFDSGERFESFAFVITREFEVNLISTSADHLDLANEWRIKERNERRMITKRFPREIIVPLSERYLEIRF